MDIKIILFTLFLVSNSANAGLFSDDLSRCLVQSTTDTDKVSLVKWIFTMASQHKEVRSLSNATKVDIDALNKQTATLFTRLIVDDCNTQTRAAMINEGPLSIQVAFQTLGQVASMQLFNDPEVNTAMEGIRKYIDNDRINNGLNIPKK